MRVSVIGQKVNDHPLLRTCKSRPGNTRSLTSFRIDNHCQWFGRFIKPFLPGRARKHRRTQYLVLFFVVVATIGTVQNLYPAAQPEQPVLVWADQKGGGRQDLVHFRLDVPLDTTVRQANLHLFAASRYHLFVNGDFIQFGPARFYPEHPRYDTHDLLPFLIQGKNVIVVKVLSNGTNTYPVPLTPGVFAAWGGIITESDELISLGTPGTWKCKESAAYDSTAPKMSFALGPMEVFDGRDRIESWDDPNADLRDWKTPVLVDNPGFGGDFELRNIPFLTQEIILPQTLLGAYSLTDEEEIISFRIKTKDRTRRDFNRQHRVFAHTYIWSPRRQYVDLGLWWGEHWLNGEGPLPNHGVLPGRPNRGDITLSLERGWNYFFIKYGIVWASWDFHIAVPKAAGLQLSPNKRGNDPVFFETAGPFTVDEEDDVLALPLPFREPKKELPELSAGWIPRFREESAGNPAWEMAWRYFGDQKPIQSWQVQNLTADDSAGTAFVFDMGGKQLGRLFVEFEAPAGTFIDIGFSEELEGDRIHILRRAGVFSAVRCIADGKLLRWESFKPYGARYLQVNITRNTGPVFLKKAGMIRQVYPFEKTGSFACSDPMFNRIWELGWRTLEVCAEDAYIDTPFRERGLYAGDALPEFAITLATAPDTRLVKRSLELFQDMYRDLFDPETKRRAENVGLLSDFPLLTLEYFRWVVDWDLDYELAKQLYPAYKQLLESFLDSRDEKGLFKHEGVFIEWTRINKQAQLAAMHALIARSLSNLSFIAALIGESKDARRFSQISDEVAGLLQTHFWDKARGAYRDGFDNGYPIESYYPISSAWPVLWGQTSPEQEILLRYFFDETLADIGNRARQRLATPYGGFYIIGALYRLGYADLAERFMRQYWSPMILDGDDTAWENFSVTDGQGTRSHAWSGGPTYHLTRHVLGVPLGYPEAVQQDTLILTPQAETIAWARGKVPHPKGVVSVDWRIQGDQLFFECQVPEGLIWDVRPRGRLGEMKLRVNGEKR